MGVLARLAVLVLLSVGLGITSGPDAMLRAEPQAIRATIGWVEIVTSPDRKDQLTIVGRVYAAEASSGRFTLIVSRVGKGGTTNTKQSGLFNVSPGENKKLSTTAVNIAPTEALQIELKLYSEEKEVFSVVMKAPPGKAARDI